MTIFLMIIALVFFSDLVGAAIKFTWDVCMFWVIVALVIAFSAKLFSALFSVVIPILLVAALLKWIFKQE